MRAGRRIRRATKRRVTKPFGAAGRAGLGTTKIAAEVASSMHGSLPDVHVPRRLGDFWPTIIEANPGYYDLMVGADDVTRTDEAIFAHMLCRWVDFGMPVFAPTHSLVASLILTDPSGVPSNEVKPPFECFAVQLPVPFWELQSSDAPIKAVTLWFHAFETNHSEQIALRVVAETGLAIWERLPSFEDKGPRIGTWLGYRLPTIRTRLRVSTSEVHIQRAARRLLVNLVLYISSGGSLGPHTSGGRQKTSHVGARGLGNLPVLPKTWQLGREIKLDRNLLAAARDWTEAQGKSRAGWRVSVRFTVRGHWKRVPHGPKRAERRLQWIKPYHKGPAEGVRLTRRYTVGEEETR